MRKFIRLIESITDDLVWNYEIEERLAEVPAEDRPMFRDGLDLIYRAPKGGIGQHEWIAKMQSLWGLSRERLADVFGEMVMLFDSLLQRETEGRYSWNKAHTEDVPIAMDDPRVQMVKQSVEYAALAHQIMRACGTFHPGEIVRRFIGATGMNSQMAAYFIAHMIEHSKAAVKPIGDGTYRWVEGQKKTGLSFLRDLEGYKPPKP